MTVTSVQLIKPGALSGFSSSRVLDLDSEIHGKWILQLKVRSRRVFGVSGGGRRVVHNSKGVCCKLHDGDDISNNNSEPPESLFMKELRKRGISPTSLLEETSRSPIEEEIMEEGSDTTFPKRNSIATDKSLTNQREQSMALNSEGLEGLIPRGKLLLRLGATFFFAFWPLIIITAASFTALYLYFGPTFVHDGSKNPITTPQYIDPYVLLQDDKIVP